MTINTQDRTAGPFAGNDVATVFPFEFKVFQNSDLLVFLTVGAAAPSTLVLDSDYSVTLNTDQNTNPGGSVTLLNGALATGTTLDITSSVAATQPTELTNQGGFFPKVIENALDRLTIIFQQLGFQAIGSGLYSLKQVLRYQELQGGGPIPLLSERKNKLFGFDNNGDPSAVIPTSDSAQGVRTDLAAVDGAGLVGGFNTYSQLRTYTGSNSRVQVIGFGISGDFYLDPSDTTSPDNGGTVIVDALGRRWKRQFEGGLDLYWFGAKGSYVDDDSDAIGLWLAAYVNGKNSLASSRGVFRHTRSFDFPDSVVIRGSGAPAIQHFPQLGGDKSLLRPGYKHLISGSTFIFSGTADKSFVTARTDRFSSGIYVWRYPHKGTAPDIEGVGFILDCDVLDASGAMTTAATDNRAVADYLFVRQDTGGALRNCTIFGYTRNYAYVRSNLAGDTLVSYDADYMKSVGCKISGGMATIGNQTGVAGTSGFTGGRCIDCDIQGGDHHNRPDGDFTRGAYYVDGYLSSTARIRGHMIIGGSLRTYANDAVITDNVNDFIVDDVTLEFPALAGVPGADTVGGFVGTVQTLKATMIAGASTDGARMLEYLTQVTGPVKQVGFGSFDSMTVAFSGNAVRLSSLASGAQIQFTSNPASSTSGFVIRRDAATGDLRFIQDNVDNQRFASVGGQMQLGLTPGSNRNIVSGVVTIGTNSNYRINGTSPSGTDVNSVDGGTYDGQIVALSTATAANPVTIKKSTSGNLRIPSDCVLSSPFSTIVLKFNGTYWTEQSRAIYV